MGSLLIFPSSMPDSLRYARKASATGKRIIASSSINADATAVEYNEWVYLPSIYDETFETKLCQLIQQQDITHFYSPHGVIHRVVEKLVRKNKLSLLLEDKPAFEQAADEFRYIKKQAKTAHEIIHTLDQSLSSKSNLTPTDITAILQGINPIYGQASDIKVFYMMAIFASAPPGDVVEIGVAWGKTAFVLSYLSRHYSLGCTIAVDPWEGSTAIQNDSPDTLNEVTLALDWPLIFEMFVANLLPSSHNKFNYLRMTSEQAARQYSVRSHVESAEFGLTPIANKLSVLHIDGNHDYNAVLNDYKSWSPFLQPGSWVIFDDYLWEHGDGPKRVADTVLVDQWEDIKVAFCVAKSLFIQFK